MADSKSSIGRDPSLHQGEPREPDRPPEIARRLSLTRKQLLGLPLLVAVPVLTLFGVFGEQRGETRAASATIEMRIHYPTRFRYRQVQPLDIAVRNISSTVLDTIDVARDTAYISRFSSVRIDPAPHTAYHVAVTHVRPGESRLVAAELWGERYGWHEGRLTATSRADTASASVRTFVFP